MTTARPPRDLGKSGREFWRDVQSSYSITDPAGLSLLEVACRALDRMAEARAVIERDGLVIAKTGRANPACKIEQDSANRYLSAHRALHLDIEPLADSLSRGENPFRPNVDTSNVTALSSRSRPTK
jgi:hypothetical protein